jgi:hypothetical protein
MKEKHIVGDESKGIVFGELEEYWKDPRALAGSVGAGSERMIRKRGNGVMR